MRKRAVSNGPPLRAAFVTIGQSPRNDILDEMRPHWEAGRRAVEIEQAGALDGLTASEIEALAPGDAPRLVSRLADGSEVALEASGVEHRVASLVGELSRRGDRELIVLLCTGAFEGLPARPLVLEAQRIMDLGVAAMAGKASRIGVLVPHPEQAARFRWSLPNETIVVHASPYADGPGRIEEAAEELRRAEVDFVALHCMGYDEAARARVAAVTEIPVLLARRLVAGAVAQLV